MEILKTKRILAAIGIICLLLGNALPYYTFSAIGLTRSLSLWGYLEGKIILILTIANALFIFKDVIEKYVPKLFDSKLGQKIANAKDPKLSLIPLILIIVFVVYLNTKANEYIHLNKGIGFYLLWLGIIAMAAHSFIYKGNNESNMNNEAKRFAQPVQENEIQPTQNQAFSQSNIKYCPNCGQAVDSNTINCPNCMHRF